MLCEKCGQNEATVRIVKIENNVKTELHLCQGCAQGYTSFTIGFDLQNILSSMFQHGALSGARTQRQKKCPTCALSSADIQKMGRLGCSNCYQTFQDELSPVLRKVHGSVTHTGKIPSRGHTRIRMSRQIEEARRRLEECVRSENYEKAAHYRDEIRRLEQVLLKEDRADGKD